MIVELFATVTLEARVPPSETVAPEPNPVPVIVIEVPPAVGPEGGETLPTVGGVGVGVGVGPPPPQGSTAPTGIQPLLHRHHWKSMPNA